MVDEVAVFVAKECVKSRARHRRSVHLLKSLARVLC